MKRVEWSQDAADMLRVTLEGYSAEALREHVASGRLELWAFDSAYAVTEPLDGVLYVWAYAGDNLRAASHEIYANAKERGCRYIMFRSRYTALARILKHLRPIPFNARGLPEYAIGVQ